MDWRKARERELPTFDENRRVVGMLNPLRDKKYFARQKPEKPDVQTELLFTWPLVRCNISAQPRLWRVLARFGCRLGSQVGVRVRVKSAAGLGLRQYLDPNRSQNT